jgi:carbonic anhydrase/acetyltransferase-like protein (isoleucine patch superfamily)
MGAIILDGAVIEDNVIIGAGTVVTSNKRIEKNSVAVGNPFKVIRETNQKDSDYITNNAKLYSELSSIYKEKE